MIPLLLFEPCWTRLLGRSERSEVEPGVSFAASSKLFMMGTAAASGKFGTWDHVMNYLVVLVEK